jgi:small conductance mechanosensitive channel
MNLTKFYDKAYDWILLEGPKILIGILIFIAAQFLIRLLKKWMRSYMTRKEFDSSIQPFLISLLFAILQIFAVIATMDVVGIKMTIFTVLIGGIGVAAGLALSGTLQNFTSGILILLLKPFRVGDTIIAQGQEGIVRSIQIFYTIVITYDNKDVIIPNSKLSNDLIINISQEGKRRMDIDIKLPFSIDYQQSEKIILQTLNDTDFLFKDPTARVGISLIEVDGYHLSVNVWTAPRDFIDHKMALQVRMMEDLRKGGVKWPGMS